MINHKQLTPTERQQIRELGESAEAILADPKVMKFLLLTRSDLVIEMTGISGYAEEHNNKRLGLSHQLTGLERFVDQLRSAVNAKNRIVAEETK